jgi:Family of unknown function (DUF5519)
VSGRAELESALSRLPGLVPRASRWGSLPAFFVGDREIAHFHKDGRLDVRLTRSVIRQRAAEGSLDPRVQVRGSSSEWVAVRATDLLDVALVVGLVEEAMRANA